LRLIGAWLEAVDVSAALKRCATQTFSEQLDLLPAIAQSGSTSRKYETWNRPSDEIICHETSQSRICLSYGSTRNGTLLVSTAVGVVTVT
jgi:hypothetical protein